MTSTNLREDDDTTAVSAHLRNLHRRTYPMRVLGMGLAILPVLVVLQELEADWPAWAWTLFCGIAWPHLALLHATCSRVPYRAELTNFMIDSAMAASLAPIMHFNLLPSAMLVTVATADKINAGVRGLWSRSLLGMLAALAVSTVLNGFHADVATSTQVLVSCLPLLIIHTLTVSASSYRLVRKVQKQNIRLDDLSRHDSLTGLQSRRHWQEQATSILDAGTPASLLLVDVDLFKSVNDRHGHSTGDDVLRAIAEAIGEAIPAGSHAGRLGGDEFAVVVPLALPETRNVAEDIRARVHSLRLGHADVQCSVSIGMAEPPATGIDLRNWMESADRALYLAKAGGRNRTCAATIDTVPA